MRPGRSEAPLEETLGALATSSGKERFAISMRPNYTADRLAEALHIAKATDCRCRECLQPPMTCANASRSRRLPAALIKEGLATVHVVLARGRLPYRRVWRRKPTWPRRARAGAHVRSISTVEVSASSRRSTRPPARYKATPDKYRARLAHDAARHDGPDQSGATDLDQFQRCGRRRRNWRLDNAAGGRIGSGRVRGIEMGEHQAIRPTCPDLESLTRRPDGSTLAELHVHGTDHEPRRSDHSRAIVAAPRKCQVAEMIDDAGRAAAASAVVGVARHADDRSNPQKPGENQLRKPWSTSPCVSGILCSAAYIGITDSPVRLRPARNRLSPGVRVSGAALRSPRGDSNFIQQ